MEELAKRFRKISDEITDFIANRILLISARLKGEDLFKDCHGFIRAARDIKENESIFMTTEQLQTIIKEVGKDDIN